MELATNRCFCSLLKEFHRTQLRYLGTWRGWTLESSIIAAICRVVALKLLARRSSSLTVLRQRPGGSLSQGICEGGLPVLVDFEGRVQSYVSPDLLAQGNRSFSQMVTEPIVNSNTLVSKLGEYLSRKSLARVLIWLYDFRISFLLSSIRFTSVCFMFSINRPFQLK